MLQFTVFDQLKNRLLKKKQDKAGNGSSPEALSASSAFALGAISKTIATILTYPAIRCIICSQSFTYQKNVCLLYCTATC